MADNDTIDPTVDLDPPAETAETDNQVTDTDFIDSGEPPTDQAEPTDDTEAEDEESEDAEQAPELIEYDFGDGQKHKIPAVAKDFLLRQEDYTKKTTEVAEQRKALEAEREALTATKEADAELQANIGRLAYVDDQLKRFAPGANGTSVGVDQIDWVTWQQRNPQEAQRALQRAQALQQQRSALQNAVEEGQTKRESEAQQALAKRIADTRAFAQKDIPNWSEDRDKAIAELVKREGVTEDQLRSVINPSIYKLLDFALDGYRYREAVAKQSKAKKVAEKDNVTPLKTVAKQRSGGSGGSLSDKASIDDWMAAREKQLKAKGM